MPTLYISAISRLYLGYISAISQHVRAGVPTLDELQPEQLQQLCKQLLTRFAQRHALEDYDGAAPSDEESDDEEDGQ